MMARISVLGMLALACGFVSASEMQSLLGSAPWETRVAGNLIRSRVRAGERIMARKPHVAYYAHMSYVPLPATGTLAELVESAQREHVGWLYFSGMEAQVRPGLLFLTLPELRLPGLEPVASRQFDSARYFSLYRVTADSVSEEGMIQPMTQALERQVREHPSDARSLANISGYLVHLGRAQEAIPYLERGLAMTPDDPLLLGFLSIAFFQLGDYDRAGAVCERAIATGHDSWSILFQLGRVRTAQQRYPEAADLLRRAADRNPADFDILVALGFAQLGRHDIQGAIVTFDHALALAPNVPELRAEIARMLVDAGESRRALDVIGGAPEAQRAPGSELAELARSIAAELR